VNLIHKGPITIDSHDAISPVYASSSAFDKSEAYVPGRLQGKGIFFIRGKEEHSVRRRIWAGAFTPQT